MRGEYSTKDYNSEITQGSPPHAWGILVEITTDDTFNRITPTCVGNTLNDSRHNSIFKLVNVHFL